MEYQAAVAEARRLDQIIEEAEVTAEESKWARADLAWEQMGAGIGIRQWARDTGKDHSTISRWIKMAERWPVGLGHQRPPFTEAYDILRGRAELGQYQTEARQAVRNMPPEQKAEVVREALAEPEVAEQVVRDTPTRTHLAKAEHTVDREQQDTAQERYELAEPRSVDIGAMADAEYGLTKIRTIAEDVSEAIDKLIAHDWPDNSKERTAVLAQRAAAAVELIRAKVEGRNLDEELAALLEGGDA